MRIAETVTFGGSGLDRAAHLRGTAGGLLAEGRVLALWRGKVLMAGEEALAGCWLAADHPVFDDASDECLFLGLDEGVPRFARDVSAWEPQEVPDTVGAFADPSEQVHPMVREGRFVELRAVMTRLSPREAELAATAKALLSWHEGHRFCSNCGAASLAELAGWQRACPACGRKHFPRTDPVVIMLITHGNDVLVGRSPGWPEGMYSLLAGFIEPGETIEAAVRREVFEEAGVKVGAVGYLASQPWPFPASLMLGCRGEALTREITVDPAELETAMWISREQLMDVLAGQSTVMKPPRAGAIAGFLLRAWLADRLD